MSKERGVACSLQYPETLLQHRTGDAENELVHSFQYPPKQGLLRQEEDRLELFLECRWRFRQRPDVSLDEQVRTLRTNKAMLNKVFVNMFVILQRDLLLGAHTRSAADIQRLRTQSREKALKLRSRLGLKEDPMKVDGFAKIRGLLGKYAEENEDPIEFLRRSREEE